MDRYEKSPLQAGVVHDDLVPNGARRKHTVVLLFSEVMVTLAMDTLLSTTEVEAGSSLFESGPLANDFERPSPYRVPFLPFRQQLSQSCRK